MDRNDYFKNPVSKADVPDYHDIVKKPMCWAMIEAKLDRHEYWDLRLFKVSSVAFSPSYHLAVLKSTLFPCGCGCSRWWNL